MKINRKSLLSKLEAVSLGLSAKAIIEQSDCFIFQDDKLLTYDDEVACSIDIDLSDLAGAVAAAPLLALLRKMTEEEIDVAQKDGELRVTGKRREAGIKMEQEIMLDLSGVEAPKSWKKMPAQLPEAIRLVRTSASNDESKFAVTCIHMHPAHVEACDNFQLSRFPLKTGVKKSTLIRQTSAEHIANLGEAKMAETKNWVHFKTESGLVLSCRRYMEEYPDVDGFLAAEGEPIELPKGLEESISKAEIFLAGGAAMDVSVSVKFNEKGRVILKGKGETGWYREQLKAKYDGNPIEFQIAPTLLLEIAKRSAKCEAGEGMLKITGDDFVFVACTILPSNEE